jgi:hypothetical protein
MLEQTPIDLNMNRNISEANLVKVAKILAEPPAEFNSFSPAEFLALNDKERKDFVTGLLNGMQEYTSDELKYDTEVRVEYDKKRLDLIKASMDAGVITSKEAEQYISFNYLDKKSPKSATPQ